MGTLPGEPLWVSTNYQPQFQRVPVNRSPVESPPIAKKLLKSGATMPSFTATTAGGGLQFLPAGATAVATTGGSGKENHRSILKRISTMPRCKSRYGPVRKVKFELSVAVVVYDPADGKYVCSASERLNTEPRDRREFVNRTLLGRLQSTKAISNHNDRTTQEDSAAGSTSARPLPPPKSTAAAMTTSAAAASVAAATGDLEFSFYEDAQGQLRLKFTVPLGPGVAAGDALVKANVAGNKVRVLGTRTLPPSNVRQEFASRYLLPMDVDPYAITARMDGNGNLFVEAPVLTNDQRQVLAARKAASTWTGAATGASSTSSSRFP